MDRYPILQFHPPRPGMALFRCRLLLQNHRAAGSMRDVQYEVSAALEVEKVDEVDNTGNIDDSEGVVDADTCRYVATKVIRASCTCQSGAGGGCHHVCQLLQLTRLLQLTEIELGSWNPKSPTSVACQWVLKNCGAGRNREQNIMHCEPMEDIARSLRTLRDPKTHPFMGGEPVKTRGVVAINRADDYSSHPDFGVWAEPKRIFDQGGPHNQLECVRLKKLVDGQRREFKRFKPDGRPSASVFSEVCLDRLPPKVL